MKTVKLSLETAKQMYKSSDEGIKAFALENYTKEELEAKELPTKWEDLAYVNGFFINSGGNICKSGEIYTHTTSSNGIWPTKELAEASVALAKLIYLRDIYNGDWKADWTSGNQIKECLYYNNTDITIQGLYNNQRILSFKDFKIANLFRNNFRDLIKIAKPLL